MTPKAEVSANIPTRILQDQVDNLLIYPLGIYFSMETKFNKYIFFFLTFSLVKNSSFSEYFTSKNH